MQLLSERFQETWVSGCLCHDLKLIKKWIDWRKLVKQIVMVLCILVKSFIVYTGILGIASFVPTLDRGAEMQGVDKTWFTNPIQQKSNVFHG